MSRRRTRLLVISDTHSVAPSEDVSISPWWTPLPSADVAIHCGDLTMTGRPQEHQRTIDLLKSLPAKLKIVIPGNHDLTLDREYCAAHRTLHDWQLPHTPQDLDFSLDVYTNTEAQTAGIRYLVEGLRSFTLDNGTRFTVYASAYTPEFCDWAFPYERSEDRFNPERVQNRVPSHEHTPIAATSNVDIMITHGPSHGILDTTFDGLAAGCKHLRQAVRRSRPLLHCFGHIHEAWGATRVNWNDAKSQDADARLTSDISNRTVNSPDHPFSYLDVTDLVPGQETQFLNASIMSVRYKPVQKPWLIDLMLPCKPSADEQ